MKAGLFVVLAFVISSLEVVAQSTVNFANAVSFQIMAERLVRDASGQPLLGSHVTNPPTFVAQLYYGRPGAALTNLISVDRAPARFGHRVTHTIPAYGLAVLEHWWDLARSSPL